MYKGLYQEGYNEVFELLFNKIPVLTIDQLTTYMNRYYGVPRQNAVKIIELFSQEGMLIITPNGYVSTREGIIRASLVEPEIKYMSHLVLKHDLIISRDLKDVLDSFWILIYNTPRVSQFVFTEPPILLTYIDEKKKRIIEVVKYRKGQELLMNQYLKIHHSYDKEGRKITERYALMEDPRAVGIVGAYGFTKFYTIEKHMVYDRELLKELEITRPFSIAWRDSEIYEKDRNINARASDDKAILGQ